MKHLVSLAFILSLLLSTLLHVQNTFAAPAPPSLRNACFEYLESPSTYTIPSDVSNFVSECNNKWKPVYEAAQIMNSWSESDWHTHCLPFFKSIQEGSSTYDYPVRVRNHYMEFAERCMANHLSWFEYNYGNLLPTPSIPAPCPLFLTFRPWYCGLMVDTDDNIIFKKTSGTQAEQETHLQSVIFIVVFNILYDLIQAVAYLTLGFVIYGGFTYIIARGSPDGIAKGKKTITNSVIGLVISVLASAIVNTIQSVVGYTNMNFEQDKTPTEALSGALNFVYFAIGLAAVIVIAYSGFVYITSSGSPEKLTRAKQTIIYAIVGLCIAIAAWAITTFILGSL